MPTIRSGRFGLLGWVGLLLCVLALVAVAVPGFGYTRARADDGVRLDGSPQHVQLPANRTYGIYVDDADNSGYAMSCSAVDARGRDASMADPGWSVSSSNTEVLDLVFDTGSGELTITCAVPGEQVTARPVPNDGAMLLGIVLAVGLGCTGLGLLLAWAVERSSRRATPMSALAVGAHGPTGS